MLLSDSSSQLDQDCASEGSSVPEIMSAQLESGFITEHERLCRVRKIYSELSARQKKCVEVENAHANSQAGLSEDKWQEFSDWHWNLLAMYRDFFLEFQFLSSSVALNIAEKYAMLARMWKYGISLFLELLRPSLPKSWDYMVRFINFAYPTLKYLLKMVPVFHETWIECLGDLARYRMAIVKDEDREIWAERSREWYRQRADLSPGLGRILFHLAILAEPDRLQQLFFYTKALVSVHPCEPEPAREHISLLFTSSGRQDHHQDTMVTAFIATHRALFMRASPHEFTTLANGFLVILRRDLRRLVVNGQQAIYIMSCNIASILEYGAPGAAIAPDCFKGDGKIRTANAHALAVQSMLGEEEMSDDSSDANTLIQSQVAYQGSSLTFHTLFIFLDQVDDPNMYPSVHLSMSFIWCMTLHPPAMQQLERYIPWTKMTRFLNSLFQFDPVTSIIEQANFPLLDYETPQPLPEDFFMHGQSWSEPYYPPGFFENAATENEREVTENPLADIWRGPRRQRCLWLGGRIATVCALVPIFI
jgi:hypothetical protein